MRSAKEKGRLIRALSQRRKRPSIPGLLGPCPVAVLLATFLLFGPAVFSATLDIPFALGRSARSFALFGVDLALPDATANPGALAFFPQWSVFSTYARPFGVVHVWAISFGGPGLSADAVLLDAGGIGPDLHYRVWAFQGAGALRLGPLGLGGRARFLRPTDPEGSLGLALDAGIFWQGLVYAGLVWEGVYAQFPGEPWPPSFSLALAWPLEFSGFSAIFGAAFLDFPALPTWAFAAEARVGPLSLRGGLHGASLNLGGGLVFPPFALDWVFTLHPDLPLSFRVSFALEWP
jgi:hypothetical protein